MTQEATAHSKSTSDPNAVFVVLEGVKYVMSTLLTLAAVAFICYGIGTDQAVLPGPWVLHYVVFVFVLVLLAYLEGLQVAILALEYASGEPFKETHPRGYKLHSLVTTGKNVQRFLVGRQFYVIFVVFLCSQVTTFPTLERPDFFPEVLWFILIKTGLHGALVVLAFGQLMPQLIASRYPMMFCNLYGSMTVLYITLILESIGITHFCWLLTTVVSTVFGLEKSDGAEKAKASAASPGSAVKMLERLARIQDEWKVAGKGFKLELLEVTGPATEKLFVTPAMAEAGLREADGKDASWDGVNATPKAEEYPTPAQIAAHLVAKGQDVPCFLLPPTHGRHVPPHILAYSLMSSLASQGGGKVTGAAGIDIDV